MGAGLFLKDRAKEELGRPQQLEPHTPPAGTPANSVGDDFMENLS